MQIIHAVAAVATGIVGVVAGYVGRMITDHLKAQSLERSARLAAAQTRKDAENLKKEAEIQAKAEVLKAKEDFETSVRTQRTQMAAAEERMSEREKNLDRRLALLEKKEHALDSKLEENQKSAADLNTARADLDRVLKEEQQKLQNIARMTQEQASRTLLARVETEMRNEIGSLVRRMQDQAKEMAEQEAKKTVALAIQRYAVAHTTDLVTSTVMLPNDELKGRIIGRDGRNIRALEAATGVSILIDDTPEAVVISGFDPIRREIARQSLERLISDGRIHPARIEEIVAEVKEKMPDITRVAGEEAAFACKVSGVSPELLRCIGRLKFRTSYTQNVLQHSIEVANLIGTMSAEMGLDPAVAKRVGLFHDIGKALDHEVEGSHALIGADLLKRQGESHVVVNAVAAHHEEVPAESLYAILAAAADAISSSRIGARSESTDRYIKRLEKLEEIAKSFEGVEKTYAIQAGREVRVIVQPERIDDNQSVLLARSISQKIQSDLQYPGQVRVVVIRETRCVEYAR